MKGILDIRDIESAVSKAAAGHDIEKVYLFGSYARGEAKESSDVDLCLETGKTFSLFNAGAFLEAIRYALGRDIDIVTERSMHEFAKSGMLKDRVVIYERL